MALDPNHEIDSARLTVDTRSAEQRFFAALYRPSTFRNFLLLFIGLQVYLPALWPVWVILLWMMVMLFQDQKFQMPLRMPKDVGGLDRTDYYEELVEENMLWGFVRRSKTLRKYLVAGGILYLGFLRSRNLHDQGRELWLTNSDARTHMFEVGTTGSGKSETLMGTFHNAICWGSGACYGDGKADSNLAFCLWSLSRRHGREDDFLILNYLTGGMDPFQRIVDEELGRFAGRAVLAQSNSMNAFGDGSADFLLQLMASLLPRASGDGAQWQQKALNMIDALLRTLCYKRAKGELDISIGVIRHYLALQNLVQFYIEGREGKIPELAFLQIKAHFETGLPGFNPAQAHDPTQWDPEVFNQHGYLTGQFARTLSMMTDTYGFIFADKYPEIDMLDVLLNNRLLVVMIPSLEKSASEAASLGKLYISSIRLMMAQNLGYRLEGTKAEVLDAKATNAPNPSVIISDELAYYFAEGIAVMFAQARSLGFMMIAAVQDVQGLKRGERRIGLDDREHEGEVDARARGPGRHVRARQESRWRRVFQRPVGSRCDDGHVHDVEPGASAIERRAAREDHAERVEEAQRGRRHGDLQRCRGALRVVLHPGRAQEDVETPGAYQPLPADRTAAVQASAAQCREGQQRRRAFGRLHLCPAPPKRETVLPVAGRSDPVGGRGRRRPHERHPALQSYADGARDCPF
ncbi:MAG: hypothetical protein PPHEESC_1797 [uncultured Paraburkholderia sp.]|nr:MAG: hypothetical protein PPHEESC_1797 [uncultured Paraburkholderia sp.]